MPVRARLVRLSPDDIIAPSVAIAELAYGAERCKDPERDHLVCREFVDPFVIVAFDRAAAEHQGQLRFELASPVGERDLLIARRPWHIS